MKKIKYLMTLCCALFLGIGIVRAEDNAFDKKLKELNVKTAADGSKYVEVNYINPEIILPEDACIMDEESTEDDKIMCINYNYLRIFEDYYHEIYMYDEETEESIYGVFDGASKLTIYYSNYSNGTSDEVDIKVVYPKYDEATLKAVNKYMDTIKNKYSLEGLTAIGTSIYYKGYVGDYMMKIFPDFQKFLDTKGEYDLGYSFGPGGGIGYEEGRNGFVYVSKNNILYGIKNMTFSLSYTIKVDKNAKGTLEEKAIAKLKETFGEDKKVTINKIDDEDFYELVKGKDALIVEYTIDDYTGVAWIENVDSEKADSYSVDSTDTNTGVSISTNSTEVPFGIVVKTTDVSGHEYVKKFELENKVSLDKVFDINLFDYVNEKNITNIKKGIEVMIPLTNYKKGNKVEVYYIKPDGSLGEVISCEAVSINGKWYAKFKTTHFSTYAVATKDLTKVPATADNVGMYLMLGLISFITMAYASLRLRKN